MQSLKQQTQGNIGTLIKHRLRQTAILKGYRSGLEEDISKQLRKLKIKFEYESTKLPYLVPSISRIYTPDFILANGIVLETKGRWLLEDRKKIELIKEQYPLLDLRMIFNYSRSKSVKDQRLPIQRFAKNLGYLLLIRRSPFNGSKKSQIKDQ